MGLVLALLGAVALILGVVTLFKPLPKLKMTTRARSLLAVVAGLVLVAVGGPPPGPDASAGNGQGDPAARILATGQGGARPQAPHRGKQTRQDMPWLPSEAPAKQLRFLASLEDARTAATDPGPGEETAIKSQRSAAICQLIRDPEASNWIGKVKVMSSDHLGRGMIAVDIGNRVLLTTAIDPKSPTDAESLVPRQSPLYADVSRFKTGDPVVLSGQFLPGDGICAKDIGSLTEPAFIFKFSSMARFF